jgi:hypothetical protein
VAADVPAFLTAGGVEEQAGEKLDRLGLLPAREASKPRAAEPKLVVQNETSLRSNERPGK